MLNEFHVHAHLITDPVQGILKLKRHEEWESCIYPLLLDISLAPGSEVNCEAAQFTVPPPRSMAVITHGSTTAFKQIHKAFVELHQELVG